MIDYGELVLALVGQRVKFIIVGGVAAIVHSSPHLTFDLDVVYARDHENKISNASFKPWRRSILICGTRRRDCRSSSTL